MNRRGLAFTLYTAVAGLEICWFWVVLDLLNQRAAGGSLPILFLLGFYPLAFVSQRMLLRLPWKKAIPLGCLAWAAPVLLLGKVWFFGHTAWEDPQWLREFGRAIIGMVHSSNPDSLLAVGSAVIWGFGLRLAYVRLQFATLVGEFQFGLAILLVLFFLDAQWEVSSRALIPATLAFFFFALGGIAVSHTSERQTWLSGHYRGRWSAFLLSTIGFILGIGWLIGAVVKPSLIEFVTSFLAMVGQWIWAWIVKFFIFLGELIPPPPLPKPGNLPPAARLPQMKAPAEKPFILFSESAREVLRFIWGAGVISLLLAALWRISSQVFEWFRRKMGGMEEAEVEPLPGAFCEDFMRFLKSLLRIFGIKWPFRRGRKTELLGPEAEFVRHMYRRLLAWAAARGHGREAAQTPYEYLPGLVAWLPERGGDFTFITEQYVRTRYSRAIPTGSGLEELKQSWQRVRQTPLKKGSKK